MDHFDDILSMKEIISLALETGFDAAGAPDCATMARHLEVCAECIINT